MCKGTTVMSSGEMEEICPEIHGEARDINRSSDRGTPVERVS